MRRLTVHRALPFLALLACAACSAAPAPGGSAAGGPSAGGASPRRPFALAAHEPGAFPSGPAPATATLGYGGGAVMGPHKNVYLIWYGNWSFGTGSTPAVVIDFVQHLGGSPYFKMNEMFWDTTPERVSNSIGFGGSVNVGAYKGTSLDDDDIDDIVEDQQGNTLPNDPNGLYMVMTSADVTESGSSGTLCVNYGGWHTNDGDTKYGLVGSPAACPTLFSWSSAKFDGPTTTPNGLEADGVVNILSHEILESVQDPNGDGWQNGSSEAGDICLFTVGTEGVYTPTGTSAVANVHLGDRDYLVQGNWLNTAFGGCDTRLTLARPAAAPAGHPTQDFNGDGIADLLWQNGPTGDVSIWSMFGTFVAAKTVVGKVGNEWHFYGTGDFDGDKKSDVVWRDERTGAISVWLMNGAVIQGKLASSAVPLTAQILGLADIDGTGTMKLLFQQRFGFVTALDLITGQARAIVQANGVPFSPSSSLQLAGTGDFDGDGRSDLLWRSGTNGLEITYMSGATIAQTFALPGAFPLVRGVGDLDGDKRADILFSSFTSSPSLPSTTVFALLPGPRGTVKQTISMGGLVSSAWRVEQVADANGDGQAEVYVRHRQTGLTAMWWLGAQHQLDSFVSLETVSLTEEMLDH